MNKPTLPNRTGLVAVISSMAVVNLIYGISFPLFALALDAQGVSNTLIGLSTVAQAGAVLLISPWAPTLMRHFGALPLMRWCTLLLAAMFVVAGHWQSLAFWFPLRLLMGCLTALLWICSESLINQWAGARWRGRIIGIYTSVGAAGFALAPLVLIATGTGGLLPFVSAAILTLAGGVPLLWLGVDHKRSGLRSKTRLWRVFRLAPAVMLANVVYAATVESISTFFALYGLNYGLPQAHSLGLLSAISLGGMLLILPLSWLADRVNPMAMLLACVVATMAGLLALPMVIQSGWVSLVFVFFFGGTSGMIYALGMMLIGQRFEGEMLAAATTVYTASWGSGSVLGPLLVGVGMDYWGVASMPLILFGLFLLYLPILLRSGWRQHGRQLEPDSDV